MRECRETPVPLQGDIGPGSGEFEGDDRDRTDRSLLHGPKARRATN